VNRILFKTLIESEGIDSGGILTSWSSVGGGAVDGARGRVEGDGVGAGAGAGAGAGCGVGCVVGRVN